MYIDSDTGDRISLYINKYDSFISTISYEFENTSKEENIMSVVIKFIKINILSLLSLPLLLISIVFRLISKAQEKVFVLLSVATAFLALSLLNALFNKPDSFLNGLGVLLGVLILFGAVVAIIVLIIVILGTIATAIFTVILSFIMIIISLISNISNDSYSKLYNICKRDYESLSKEGKGLSYACVFWHLVNSANWLVAKFLSLALPISIAASIGFAAYCIITVKSMISETFE